jgi:hypothetical protein
MFPPRPKPGASASVKITLPGLYRCYWRLFVPSPDAQDRFFSPQTNQVMHNRRAAYSSALAHINMIPPDSWQGGICSLKIFYTMDEWLWAEMRFGKQAVRKERLAQVPE